MVVCSFIGHRLAKSSLIDEVIPEIEKIVLSSDETVFYSGAMGDFDQLCGEAVRKIKEKYPERKIKLCWVLPSYSYAPDNLYLTYLHELYDEIFVCEASDGTHYKAMIGKRNRWMMEKSDYVLSYVIHSSGGAYTALRYAERLGTNIIRIGLDK